MKVLLFSIGLLTLFAFSEGVAHGAACTSDTDCTETNNECDLTFKTTFGCTKGTCACKTGHGIDGGACKPYVNVGVACSSTNMCVEGSSCNATSSQCECNANLFVINSDATKCIKQVHDGDCTVDLDCLSGNCTNAKCACDVGITVTSGVCVKKAFSETCSQDSNCVTTASNCSTTCTCPLNKKRVVQDQYLVEGDCLPDAAVVDVAADAVCSSSAPYKVCTDGHACIKCPEGTTYNCKLVTVATEAPENGGVRTEMTMVTLALTSLLVAILY